VLHRETQPLIRQKLGEWVYDPAFVWKGPKPFDVKREIPIYYVAVKARDRTRRDSQAWSALYGAKVAKYISKKISVWVMPKRYLVVSPYGITDDETMLAAKDSLKGKTNILFQHDNKNFLSSNHLPFTFTDKEWKSCDEMFKDQYIVGGDNVTKKWSDIYCSIDTSTYTPFNCSWHFDVSSWHGYHTFLRSDASFACVRPKYMVQHKWHGLVKDK
jgi:hypothetical protein